MKKREFLRTTGILALGAMVAPLVSCNEPTTTENENDINKDKSENLGAEPVSFELPKLEYAFDALAPYIDAQTMEIHHDKHHAGYTKKFNKALAEAKVSGKTLEEILTGLQDNDSDTNLRNNGGGYYNHKLFWSIMGPNAGGEPTGALAEAINGTFDSFENFANQFKNAAATQFGSGWAWLCVGEDRKLFVSSTPNQDNPLMKGLTEKAGTPIMGLDVWEHAYYLNYQNRRKEYINAFFNVVRWDRVTENLNKVVG